MKRRLLGTGKAPRVAPGAQGFDTVKRRLIGAGKASREAQGAQGFGP